MVAQKKTKASKFLTVPTRPIPVDRDRSVAGLLEKMEGAGFGAKQLAEAHRIWLDMLDDNSTIYLCGSGNLITSGMRRLLAYVIKNRFVDVLVLSGSVLFHDIHETLGRNHYQAHPSMNDEELEQSDVVRVGDLLANSDEYHEADEWIGSVINQLDMTRPYSVREFLHLLGRELAEIAHEDGILTAAFKSRIPVFCPDILEGPISVGIARARFEKKIQFTFDITQDTMEMMHIAQRRTHRPISLRPPRQTIVQRSTSMRRWPVQRPRHGRTDAEPTNHRRVCGSSPWRGYPDPRARIPPGLSVCGSD